MSTLTKVPIFPAGQDFPSIPKVPFPPPSPSSSSLAGPSASSHDGRHGGGPLLSATTSLVGSANWQSAAVRPPCGISCSGLGRCAQVGSRVSCEPTPKPRPVIAACRMLSSAIHHQLKPSPALSRQLLPVLSAISAHSSPVLPPPHEPPHDDRSPSPISRSANAPNHHHP